MLQSRLETYIENLTQIHSFFKRLPNEYHKEKEGVKNHLDAAHSLMERSTFILSKCNFSSENFKNPKINQLFLNETKLNERIKNLETKCFGTISSLGFEISYSGSIIREIFKKENRLAE